MREIRPFGLRQVAVSPLARSAVGPSRGSVAGDLVDTILLDNFPGTECCPVSCPGTPCFGSH